MSLQQGVSRGSSVAEGGSRSAGRCVGGGVKWWLGYQGPEGGVRVIRG
jgi:hypothetical protein